MITKCKYRIWRNSQEIYWFVTTKKNLEVCIDLMEAKFCKLKGWFMSLSQDGFEIIVHDKRVIHRKQAKVVKMQFPKPIVEKISEKELAGFFDEKLFFEKYKY